jgi:GT2 family glycosyltransferase
MPTAPQTGSFTESLMPACATAAAQQPIDVSIVVITWNSARWIAACLRSIEAACEGLSWEAVVFDNASADATASISDEVAPHGVRVIRSAANLGFAGGVNSALRGTRGRYVFLLNPDCELRRGTVAMLVEALESDRSAAAAAPLLVDESGAIQRDFQLRRLPTLKSLLAELLLLNDLSPSNRYASRHHYREIDLAVPQSIEQPAAAALLVRSTVVEQLGGLDEDFAPAWFEDVDFCRRIKEARFSIRLVPRATAVHHGGSSLSHMTVDEFLQIWYRNLFRYTRKWFSAAEVELVRWAIILGMLLRAGAVLTGIRSKGPQGAVAGPKAYLSVARRAWERWDSESQSS